jgi:hypothetical protein
MLLESVLDRTEAGKKLTFGYRLSRNSRSSKYQTSRQLSQLSDGLFSGSKRLAICELRLSELGRITESGISGHTVPFGINLALSKISP